MEILYQPTTDILYQPTTDILYQPTTDILYQPTTDILYQPTTDILYQPTTDILKHQKSHKPCPNKVIFVKEEIFDFLLSPKPRRERSELQEDRTYDCSCNSGSTLRDSIFSFSQKISSAFRTVLPEPVQTG